jgi:hypothetical protein
MLMIGFYACCLSLEPAPLLGGIFAVLIGGQCQISLTIAPGKAKKQPEVN